MEGMNAHNQEEDYDDYGNDNDFDIYGDEYGEEYGA